MATAKLGGLVLQPLVQVLLLELEPQIADGSGIFGFQQGVIQRSVPYPITWLISFYPSVKMKDLIDRWIKRQGPEILPFQILSVGKLTTLSVPGELTAMAGRRPREAVKETLISNGGGEFTEETHVHSLPAASTLYGPRTLSEYTQEFSHLALAMEKGGGVLRPADWSPPHLSSKVLKLLADPFRDSLPSGEVPKETNSIVYRPRHSGSSKKAQDSPIEYFSGASCAFTMS
ncbi:hypothetical protein POTOM_020166 [Populus tomentosa]|uniref:Neutral/alkaline non-lysosomal ceramidase N-terminal domain-containing protein n=1 Tax=Populus tomentosa TaxID=118781 RepID=A0A8X8D5L5_POPTO|nr:hypothetical protein POTOM_020166 [Populus tomentosa]